ncbi:AAA family ATPase, partial [Streptomyces caeruleatus]
APTGKAAVRASESLAKNGINLKARTIHGTLGVIPIGGESEADDGWAFRYNSRNQLPVGYLIVDEVSMLDTDLAAALLSACPVGM